MDRTVQNMVRRGMSLAQLRSFPNDISASKIRKSFIDFFRETNNHLHVRSAPVFSLRDPTLAFVNAGMNQFKDVFLGLAQAPSPRIVNSQKCIRIGGKHNDLSQVGNDGTHHTFFEMLGNWSFNDYFKEDACKMSWEFLTKICGLPPERLYVTYFGGDEKLGISPDVEVQEIWRGIGVKESHILPFGVKDNFWEASTTGPCGPCTEIHYDHCPGRTDAASLVNSGSTEVTELWNLVFIQYNRLENGNLEKLKRYYVDTGMGFERLVAVLQNKTSNYDTDLFSPLFEAIKKVTGHSGYTGKYDGNAIDCGYRILADHSRMISVALSDGMMPNLQYKVKGIIRKAVNVSNNVFHTEKSILRELSKYVAETLSDAYPEIGNNLPKIDYILENEEESLKKQIQESLGVWKKITKGHPKMENIDISEFPALIGGFRYIKKNILNENKKSLSDEDIFTLFDTYGVHVGLTEQVAKLLDLEFNRESYERYLVGVKGKTKENLEAKYKEEKKEILNPEIIKELENKNLNPTVDYFKYDYRIDGSGNYIFKEQPSTIIGIVFGDKLVDEISSSDIQGEQEVGLILDRTQLFSKEDNQESDSGKFIIENKIHFIVNKVLKVRGLAVHFGTFTEFPSDEKVSVENIGVLNLDENKRINTMRNHTALHILNSGIRSMLPVCGEKFSFVSDTDLVLKSMWYKKKLSFDDVKKLEDYVKSFILHGVAVKTRVLRFDEYQNTQDVIFIPGDYVLSSDVPIIQINSGFNLSTEYCKGTHVLNTGDLKDFVITKYIIGQYGVSTIVAVTGERALEIRQNDEKIRQHFNNLEQELKSAEGSKVDEVLSKLEDFQKEFTNVKNLSFSTYKDIQSKIKEALDILKETKNKNFSIALDKEIAESFKKFKNEFLVHYATTNCENNNLLDSPPKVCEGKPAILFNKIGDDVRVSCFVPKLYTEKGFSAEEWVTACVGIYGIFGLITKNTNPNEVFYTSEKKLTEEQIKIALNLATIYAERRLKKITL